MVFMNGGTNKAEAEETLAGFRREIDQIDYRLFHDAFPARRYDTRGNPLCKSLSLYREERRESLRKKGYRAELFDCLLIPIIDRICVPGD